MVARKRDESFILKTMRVICTSNCICFRHFTYVILNYFKITMKLLSIMCRIVCQLLRLDTCIIRKVPQAQVTKNWINISELDAFGPNKKVSIS